jgi:hypothetical protein
VGANLLDELNISNDSLRKLDSLMKDINSLKNVTLLKNNDTLNVNWIGNEIVLNIWDGYKEDNDIINIYFNNKLIEDNLIIKNKTKSIKIPFNEDKGALKIVAVNEGNTATNTVNFLLKNETSIKPFMSILNKGEYVLVEFNH